VRLNDQPPAGVGVGAQVVLHHRGDLAGTQQRPVVLVEIVGDEHPVVADALFERADGGDVAAADGIHRADIPTKTTFTGGEESHAPTRAKRT
jgi:hypothetical protein